VFDVAELRKNSRIRPYASQLSSIVIGRSAFSETAV
jgi:hypothetical protein